MAAFSFRGPRGRAVQTFIQRLGRSRFFTISVALHFVFVLSFGSVVLVHQALKKDDGFVDPGGGLVAPPAPPAADLLQPLAPPSTDLATASLSVAPSLSAIKTNATTNAFVLPGAVAVQPPTPARVFAQDSGAPAAPAPQPKFGGVPLPAARGIKQFTKVWSAPGDSGSGVSKSRAFKFTAYLAKYAGGDWHSTVRLKDDRITAGSLPNLLGIIRKWSRDKIDAEAEAVPLDLAGEELLTRHPPFVFFTGHRDFVLTDAEVANLQKYVQLGGAIWGDSSLPGERSRFDLAFRREMKRVLPDLDVSWEALPPDHPLFTQTYFPEIRTQPPGVNSYREPVYALRNNGEIAVLYTANDYGDMWQIGLTEQGKYDLARNEYDAMAAVNPVIFDARDLYFRGLGEKELVDSYKFGTNVILHLLTRWEDKLRNVPVGL